jgi:hypothetical protein
MSRREEELELVSLGDYVKCPHCGAVSRVVWVSQDGKGAGIQCPGRHSQLSRGPSQLGSSARPVTKAQNNMVFLVETESVKPVSWARR